MDIYAAFENKLVDEAKEFPLSETASITLRPIGGETARRAFEKMMEPYSVRLNAGGKLTDTENRDLNARFYAHHVIKGWKGIKDREGKEIKFSADAAETLLKDKALERFFTMILKMSADDDSFRETRDEDDSGN